MAKRDPKQMAEDRADWLMPFIRKVYVDAMVHGYGHGYEDATNQTPKEQDNGI